MRRVRQGFLHFCEGTRRQEFQQHRQVIRQFRCGGLEPACPVGLDQTDHCTAAVPAFAMNVLEEIERQRPRAVEEHHITLLQIVEVGVCEAIGQRAQRSACIGGDARIGTKNCPDLGHRLLKFPRGIAQDQRQGFQGTVQHQKVSCGRANFFFLPPKSVVLPASPVEQPLPSVKPQPPRMSAPCSFCSRCAVGIAKRSS